MPPRTETTTPLLSSYYSHLDAFLVRLYHHGQFGSLYLCAGQCPISFLFDPDDYVYFYLMMTQTVIKHNVTVINIKRYKISYE